MNKILYFFYRKRLQWLTEYTNCEIGSTDVWFQAISTNDDEERERNLEKSFFLSVENVRYSREVAVPNTEGLPAHFLTVRGNTMRAVCKIMCIFRLKSFFCSFFRCSLCVDYLKSQYGICHV